MYLTIFFDNFDFKFEPEKQKFHQLVYTNSSWLSWSIDKLIIISSFSIFIFNYIIVFDFKCLGNVVCNFTLNYPDG